RYLPALREERRPDAARNRRAARRRGGRCPARPLGARPRLHENRAESGRALTCVRRPSAAMYLPELIVRSRRVVTGDGVRPAALHIRGGRIIGVLDFENAPDGCRVDEAGDLVVMPGVVDTHVHVDASAPDGPDAFGQTTRAAAAGGVTTILDVGSVGP